MIARTLASLTLVFAAVAAPAAADPASTAQPQTLGSEEKICEKITVTGSRLATKKICATRAEWEARRQQDKEATEQFQMMRNNPCYSTNQQSPSTRNC
jgi:hypothetical protein